MTVTALGCVCTNMNMVSVTDQLDAPEAEGSAESEAPLSENLLEQFAAYYIMSVLAVRALEAARAHYAKTESRPD